MDFHARQYDPQLGRLLSVDPLAAAQGQEVYSPYAAMGNAPESMVDPNGELPINMGVTAWQNFVQRPANMPAPKYNGPSGNRMDDFDSWMNDLATGRAALEARFQRQEIAEAFAEANALYQQGNGVQQEETAGSRIASEAPENFYSANDTEDPTSPDIFAPDPNKNPDVIEYKKNETKMHRNSMKIEALSKLTGLGQLRFLIDDMIEKWEKCCGKEVIQSTTNTLMLITPLKYDLSVPGIPSIIINKGAGMGTKTIIKNGVQYILDDD